MLLDVALVIVAPNTKNPGNTQFLMDCTFPDIALPTRLVPNDKLVADVANELLEDLTEINAKEGWVNLKQFELYQVYPDFCWVPYGVMIPEIIPIIYKQRFKWMTFAEILEKRPFEKDHFEIINHVCNKI